MEKEKKLYGILIGVSLFIFVVISFTVAWLIWRSTSSNISLNSDCFTIDYSKGQDINNPGLRLLDEKLVLQEETDGTYLTIAENMVMTTASIMINSKCNISGTGNLYINIDTLSDAFKAGGDSYESLKYVVIPYETSWGLGDITVSNLLGENFLIQEYGTITNTGSTLILSTNLSNQVKLEYIIVLYIDGNLAGNSVFQDASFTGTISAEAIQKPSSDIVKGNVVTSITNIYNSSNKTSVINNNITYQYDTKNNLMKDTAGNIRYYGTFPNNYIDIGDVYKSDITKGKWEELGAPFNTEEECKEFLDCSINYAEFGFSSEDECNSNLPTMVQQEFGMTIEEFNNTYCVVETIPKGTPILYRIIGVFGDKIKVIRNASIGNYSWDTSASDVNSGYGVNELSGADLMKLINPGYESESIGGSLWYNSGSGTCYNGDNNASTECDFTVTGLSDNVKNKIAEVTWNLGGWNNSEVYPNQIYEYERGTNVVVPGITCSGTYCNDTITRTTCWTGKVSLAYPSDYGYAADLTQCSQTLNNYNNATCTSNNWLYNSAYQWLLTPNSSNACSVWGVDSSGYVGYGLNVFSAFGVRPVLYLNSDTSIISGSGKITDPYKISS